MSVPVLPDPARFAIPLPESPLFERWLRDSELTDEQREQARSFSRDGYLLLDLDLEDFDAVVARILADLAPRYPADDRRVMEAWVFDEDVRRVAIAPKMMELLQRLYQRKPIPFQTLNFDKGTEQPAHSDTLHFHCAPKHFMVGAWVAFEDIDKENGALVVYPGSHRLPTLDMHDLGLPSEPSAYTSYEAAVREILAEAGVRPKVLEMKKGQVVLWAANLYHGGTPIGDPTRTRHSQVTHYYFEDCLYYFPMASDPFARQMCMREVIDLCTLKFVPHNYRGRRLELTDYRYVLAYPRPLPDTVQSADLPPAIEMDDGLPEATRQRIWELEDAMRFQREDLAYLKREREELVGMLHRTWSSLPYRFLHGVRKTLRAWRGNREPVS